MFKLHILVRMEVGSSVVILEGMVADNAVFGGKIPKQIKLMHTLKQKNSLATVTWTGSFCVIL